MLICATHARLALLQNTPLCSDLRSFSPDEKEAIKACETCATKEGEEASEASNTGVTWNKRAQAWEANVYIDKEEQYRYLGAFDDEKEAINACETVRSDASQLSAVKEAAKRARKQARK